jgi:hypothetical protein
MLSISARPVRRRGENRRPTAAKGATVRYMLLIYSDPEASTGLTPEDGQQIMKEYFDFTQAIVDSKEMVAGDPLQGVETATTVRVRDGERITTDGPFAETREVLGGYYIVDVPDLDRAIELAGNLPGARRGLDSIEVRPLMELPPDMLPRR